MGSLQGGVKGEPWVPFKGEVIGGVSEAEPWVPFKEGSKGVREASLL